MKALWAKDGAVLLIDEIDKSDDEFEAFLLELLSDYQISIPELGTIKARSTPLVFLTSNNTREIGDALKRRCLHLFIPFPETDLERRIIRSRVPEADGALRNQLVAFVQGLRALELKKRPAISETIAWARALVALGDDGSIEETLGVVLKVREDIDRVRESGLAI